MLCIVSDVYFESSSKFRGYTQDLFMPLGVLFNTPMEMIAAIPDSLRTRSQLKSSLEQSLEENKKRKVIHQYLERVTKNNEELNSLWSSARLKFDNYSFAKKRSISTNEFQPLLIVDIESNNNVTKNDVLLSQNGLVGKVIFSGLYSAEIMLLHDVRSSVPITSEKSKLHGNVRGSGIGRNGNIEFIKKTATYELGEKLYTSGIAGIFPEGILVGEIVTINDLTDSEYLEIEVSFIQSPLNQDFYLIYKNE